MKFFEDIAVGERRQLGAHAFTAAEIKRFAAAFDPQPFHMDEEGARSSHFGRLCASGWHTLAVWAQLHSRAVQEEDLAREAAPIGRLGASPGFDELKWLKPVYAGDTISFETEVVAKRISRSRPEWGIVTLRNTGRNQRGEDVLSFLGHVFVERRDKTPPD